MPANPLLALREKTEAIVSSMKISGASTPQLVKEIRENAKAEVRAAADRLEEIALIKLICESRSKKGKAGKGVFFDTPLLRDISFNNSYAIRRLEDNVAVNKSFKKATLDELIDFHENKRENRRKNINTPKELIILRHIKEKLGDGSLSIEDVSEKLKSLN